MAWFVTMRERGYGAVRELCDLILNQRLVRQNP